MQQLIQNAISAQPSQQSGCLGLLSGCGNLIENHIIVTNIAPTEANLITFCQQADWLGMYFTSDHHASSAHMQHLSELIQRHHHTPPDGYLRLDSEQKGRIEAHLFADATCTMELPLSMQEDGDLYPTIVNR